MSQPGKAAVLGSPIAHSLSPVLHLAAYAALGLRDWTYTAMECDEAGLAALLATPGWAGLVAALAEAGVTAPSGATILGVGATACAALAALRETGLRSAAVLVRDRARAGDLLAAAARLGMEVDLRPVEAGVRDGDLLVSTVPAGAADPYAERACFSRPGVPAVLDVVYNPWPTSLAQAAARSGAVVVSGFDLLLHQAARQVELMTGIKPAPLSHMRTAGHAELARRATA